MADPTIRFIIFALFSGVCLAGGYLARKRRAAAEQISRPLHLWTVVLVWSPVALVAFWHLPLDRDTFVLMTLQPVQMLIAWGAAVLVARMLKCERGQTAVVILSAALSNQGFTLGAYLCYALLSPSDQALSYAMAFVTMMQVFMVLVFYPIARSYSSDTGTQAEPMGKLIRQNFLDIRAAPLYLALVGIMLSGFSVAIPSWIGEYHVMEILFFIGAIGSYAGIGLRLRLGDSRKYLKLHFALAAIRFALVPLAMMGVLAMLHFTPLGLGTLPRDVVVIEVFTPTAIAAVIVPNLFGLDARLASVLWLWNTIIWGAICLPVILLVF